MSIGRQVGISDEQTLACMKDEEKALDLVQAFQTNSKNDNITSTPSLILNGKLLKNMPFEELKKEIEKALN
jgi:protein-disulfide isomerase